MSKARHSCQPESTAAQEAGRRDRETLGSGVRGPALQAYACLQQGGRGRLTPKVTLTVHCGIQTHEHVLYAHTKDALKMIS